MAEHLLPCWQEYPNKPFLLRVISPRCVWYTGHVTAGGSICVEALTLSGGPNSWNADHCVESVLNLVVTNMCALQESQQAEHNCIVLVKG